MDRARADDRDGELAWTATRYALGELSAEDAATFETRMADDPAACDALATSIDELQALQAASRRSFAELGRSERPTVVGFAGLAIAATLVLGVALLTQYLPRSQPANGLRQLGLAVTEESIENALVAASFAEVHDFLHSDADEEQTQAAVDAEPVSDDVPVPNWLVEAAARADSGAEMSQ